MSDALLQDSGINLTEDQVTMMFTYIRSKTGMVFAPRLKTWVLKQFEMIYKATKSISPGQFLLDLIGERKPMEAQAFFESLTVHETMFYRDKKYFSFVKDTMLPDLINKNRLKKSLSIWIAAGSSGQEIYSILFTILNNFPELLSWNLNFYSTDISSQIIKKAKDGMYEAHEIQRGLEPADLTKFFIKLNDRNWQIKPEFRSKVTFQTSNLVESFAMLPTFDFISCRNVLIYFDDTTKMDIVKRLGDNLNKGGYLILGQVDYINCKIPPQGVSYKIADGFPYYIKDQA